MERRLSRLPRRTLERVPADAASSRWVAEAFSTYLVNKWGVTTWLAYASSHRREYGKWKRVTALRILFHIAYEDILPLLERALIDRDQDVVGAAVVILGDMGIHEAAKLLVDALSRELYPPSRIAAHLDGFPVPIPDQLLPLLGSPSPPARFWAATLLSRYPETTWLGGKLDELAEDAEPLVRKAAVESLGLIGGPAAASAALKLLDDPIWYVKAHAARALGDLGRQDLAGHVVPLLSDREWWVRMAAKESLLAMGEGAWESVVALLDHDDRFARNGAAEVLQNGGWLEEAVERAARGDKDETTREALRKAFSAGGARLVQFVAWRNRELPGLAELLEELGLEEAGGPPK